MQRIIGDFFRYSTQKHASTNRRGELMKFMFKDYPAYLWDRPSLRRVIVFPFLLLSVIFSGYTQE